MSHPSSAPPLFSIDPTSAMLAPDLAFRIREASAPARVVNPRWHKERSTSADELRCTYCHCDLTTLPKRERVVDYLVPKHVGGPSTDENLVPCCRSCSTRKEQLDIGPQLVASSVGLNPEADSLGRLTARRIAVLQSAAGHLTPHKPWAPQASIEEHLGRRWSHPRLAVFAAHREPVSFIGWSNRSGPGDALGVCLAALRFQHQGVVLDHGVDGVTLVALPPSQFLAAIWELIELHALVTPLLDAVEPDLKSDWRHAWRYHVTGMSTLRSRRVARGLLVPGAPKVYSQSPRAVKVRERRARVAHALVEDQAREAHELADTLYREYRAAEPNADAREVWSRHLEVHRLYKVWRAIRHQTSEPS